MGLFDELGVGPAQRGALERLGDALCKGFEEAGAGMSFQSLLAARERALAICETNRVRDPALIDALLQHSFSHSEFAQLSLYHHSGFFEQVVDYHNVMPLLPRVLTPWFGQAWAGLLTEQCEGTWGRLYGGAEAAPNPVFLGLGCGDGVLDVDLIQGLFRPAVTGHGASAVKIRNDALFILSDRTENAAARLRTSVDDLSLLGIGARLQVMKLDAARFSLPPSDFGVVYANELLDNMAVEPLIKLGADVFCVRLVPVSPSGLAEASPRQERSEAGFSYAALLQRSSLHLSGSPLTKEEFAAMTADGAAAGVHFTPALIPLVFDPQLYRRFQESAAARRGIDDPNFAGLYPLHLGIDSLLANIKTSFRHGVVLFDDYTNLPLSLKNWHTAIGMMPRHAFGTADIDFEIDMAHVGERAACLGMTTVLEAAQPEVLERFHGLRKHLTLLDLKRRAELNGTLDLEDPGGIVARAELEVAVRIFAADGRGSNYRFLGLEF